MATDRSRDPIPSRPWSELVDALSTEEHDQTSAATRHWQVAKHLWHALKSLGYTRGHMLAIGVDADLLAGRPPARRRHDPDRGPERLRRLQFHSPIPAGNRWPRRGLTLHQPDSHDDPHQYDVVIANLPYNDVIFADPGRRAVLAAYHGDLITGALRETAPGGVVVALAAHAFMDDRNPRPREQVGELADLAGAIRLPQGSLRPTALCFGPIDLLLLRRRPPGSGPAPTSFQTSSLVSMDESNFYLNEYWQAHPERMAGYLEPSLEPTVATLYAREGDLDLDLPGPVDQMIAAARRTGLTASRLDTSDPASSTPASPPAPSRRTRATPGHEAL